MNTTRLHAAGAALLLSASAAMLGLTFANDASARTDRSDDPTVREVIPGETLRGIGAGQCVATHNGLAYVLGDTDTGIIRECRVSYPGNNAPAIVESAADKPRFVPTGRDIVCTRDGEDVAPHPTGLALHPERGTDQLAFLGDTVRQTGLIFTIRWGIALTEGNLDNAIVNTTVDDLAANGTRPVWVRYDADADGPMPERWVVATSDYGDEMNTIRLYDPDRLAVASRTSAPGVLIASFPCTPFVQSMAWIDEERTLVLAQNRTPGLGYRLTFAALEAGTDMLDAPTVVIDALTDELEGVAPLGEGRYLLLSAMREDNVNLVHLDGAP